jgi:hypothetical protein
VLRIQRIIDALDVLSAPDLDLVVDPRSLWYFEDDVPQRGRGNPPHGQSTRKAEDSLGEVYLVGLTPEEEGAVAAFNTRDFATCEEPVDRRFVDEALLQLVDGQATHATSD